MGRLKLAALLLLFSSVARAEVSFTFDDGYTSIIENGFPVLDQYHFKGTVYIITGVIGVDKNYMNWGDIDTLHKRGWVIGSHTVTHPSLDKLSIPQIRRELRKSAAALRYHDIRPVHFAPPFGDFTPRTLVEIKKLYASNRMAWYTPDTGGLNDGRTFDRYAIQVVPLNEDTDLDAVKKLIDRAATENKWLVFMIHRVLDSHVTQPYQISREKLKQVVEYTVESKAQVVTVDQYLRYHR